MNELTTGQAVGLGVTLAALVAYPLIMRGLASWVEPTRARMAEIGKELLSSPHLSEAYKDVVDSMLDDAYDWRYMANAAVRFPTYVIGRWLGLVDSIVIPPQPKHKETSEKFFYFLTCHIRATAAANPFFAFILALEVALLAIVFVPMGWLQRLTDTLFKVFLLAEDNNRFRHSSG